MSERVILIDSDTGKRLPDRLKYRVTPRIGEKVIYGVKYGKEIEKIIAEITFIDTDIVRVLGKISLIRKCYMKISRKLVKEEL